MPVLVCTRARIHIGRGRKHHSTTVALLPANQAQSGVATRLPETPLVLPTSQPVDRTPYLSCVCCHEPLKKLVVLDARSREKHHNGPAPLSHPSSKYAKQGLMSGARGAAASTTEKRAPATGPQMNTIQCSGTRVVKFNPGGNHKNRPPWN